MISRKAWTDTSALLIVDFGPINVHSKTQSTIRPRSEWR